MYAEWTIRVEFSMKKKDVDTFKELARDAAKLLATQAAMLSQDTPAVTLTIDSNETGHVIFSVFSAEIAK